MGLFSKKKNTAESDSALTESEIQKKLYGEFNAGHPNVALGDRDHSKGQGSSSVFSRELPSEKEPAQDLFSASEEGLLDPVPPPRQNYSEQKLSDQASRYVPLHDFEKKPASPVSTTSGAEPYARFPYNRPPENKMDVFAEIGKGAWAMLRALSETLSDPKQIALRRFIYWGVAVLVVFLLFWGVNTLNSQREEAMRARYKMSGKPVVAEVPAVVVAAPVAEREVIITPAPVRAEKATVSKAAGTAAAAVSSGGHYVIQVVTYPSRQDAEQIATALKRTGLRAFVQENSRPSGRIFYLVLIGGFRTAADAQAQLLKFRALEAARPFQDAFVRTNRS